ncbi:MAG: hypothetical protein ACKV2V_04370 [Blastocatellia bacterium]
MSVHILIPTTETPRRHALNMTLSVIALLIALTCFAVTGLVHQVSRDKGPRVPLKLNLAAAPVAACTPPRYQGYVNSCSGLRVLWLPVMNPAFIGHFELKRYGKLIANNLPANANGYSDLQGCDSGGVYEIIQVLRDGTRCSTMTAGPNPPHSYPCDKCANQPTPTPTPAPTPAPTGTPRPGVTPAPAPNPNIRVLNAASYLASVAPGSIAAIFGVDLTTVTLSAYARPLPEDIGGTRVTVNGLAAKLLYVSPAQINLIIPDNAGAGVARIVITRPDTQTRETTATLLAAAPGIFTLQANGRGVPAGLTTFDGIYYQPTGFQDGSARTLSVGSLATPAYLVLFGTGIRGRAQLQDVRVIINGLGCPVMWAGPQPGFDGLDQINIQLPQFLRNGGDVEVDVSIGNTPANLTRLMFGG